MPFSNSRIGSGIRTSSLFALGLGCQVGFGIRQMCCGRADPVLVKAAFTTLQDSLIHEKGCGTLRVLTYTRKPQAMLYQTF